MKIYRQRILRSNMRQVVRRVVMMVQEWKRLRLRSRMAAGWKRLRPNIEEGNQGED
jgi:hypothetical protein